MGLHNTVHWMVKRYRATVINDIWAPVVLFSAWATVVQVISVYKYDLAISNQILTVLGTVLGLVVSFRTSSAYERYGGTSLWHSLLRVMLKFVGRLEGRKLWTTIQLASRNLAILIWVHVPTDRPMKVGETATYDPTRRKLEAIIEKKSMINLVRARTSCMSLTEIENTQVQAFSVSVKHLLRGEPGVYWEDLYPLVSFLPHYAHHKGVSQEENLPLWDKHGVNLRKSESPGGTRSHTPEEDARGRRSQFDPEKAMPDVPSQYELGPARSPPPMTIYDVFPFLIILKPLISLVTRMITGL